MCQFFSFCLLPNGRFIYHDAKQRAAEPEHADSHSVIYHTHGVKVRRIPWCMQFEYNPFTNTLTVDKCAERGKMRDNYSSAVVKARRFVDTLDWSTVETWMPKRRPVYDATLAVIPAERAARKPHDWKAHVAALPKVSRWRAELLSCLRGCEMPACWTSPTQDRTIQLHRLGFKLTPVEQFLLWAAEHGVHVGSYMNGNTRVFMDSNDRRIHTFRVCM